MITNSSKNSLKKQIDAIKFDMRQFERAVNKYEWWLLFWQVVTFVAVISLIITISYTETKVDKIFLSLIGFASLICSVVGGAFWAEMKEKIRVKKRSIQLKQQKLRKLRDKEVYY